MDNKTDAPATAVPAPAADDRTKAKADAVAAKKAKKKDALTKRLADLEAKQVLVAKKIAGVKESLKAL